MSETNENRDSGGAFAPPAGSESYSLQQLKEIADSCYSARWKVGKDYFEGVWAMLDVIKKMEEKGVSTVQELIGEMDANDPNYPL